jgi:amino acid transporter
MPNGADSKTSLFRRIKNVVIGKAHSLQDSSLFHRISLIAFFAWIGLGSDGLSSSCYGPQEAFLALGSHPYLSIFVALGTVLTIFVISASYSQIIELFPTGGGGYGVASKLLSPNTGMVAGCALLIDYVLTITVSIASGADAVFSLLPAELHSYKIFFAIAVVVILMLLNMRGVKESILILAPIFLVFLITHVFIILYAILKHSSDFTPVAQKIGTDIQDCVSQIGLTGMLLVILRSYSMGAGTYTGIEAVSNAVPVLREPRVQTAKKTMNYMAVSLSFVVMGLMLGYIFYNTTPTAGRTLNASLFETVTQAWKPGTAYLFIFISLTAEAALLFVAAQTGFVGGPRVLANMALDRWFPTRFSTLSDRLVTQNGILIIGCVALCMMVFTGASVRLLVVLYSINVFITFVLSQLGMVKHWWQVRSRKKGWHKKLLINSVGLAMSVFILCSMIIIKFHDGGWITLLITGALIGIAMAIKRHYLRISKLLRRLNPLVAAVQESPDAFPFPDMPKTAHAPDKPDPDAKTAVILVNGFNGMGLHILFNVMRLFGASFKNFIFLQVGVVDAGNFKGASEVDRLKEDVESSAEKYVSYMRRHGFYSEAVTSLGVNIVDEAAELVPKITERFPNTVFFGGQLIFEKETFASKIFHNYTVFTLQKRLYEQGVPFVILPVRVESA